ncbi:TPA: hypothetical protein QDB21_005667 [Burkholderia vietnamiensis]|nr:hypothetical protein [Burkholderia vietnamiensis]
MTLATALKSVSKSTWRNRSRLNGHARQQRRVCWLVGAAKTLGVAKNSKAAKKSCFAGRLVRANLSVLSDNTQGRINQIY